MAEGNKKEDPPLYKEALCRDLEARPLAPFSCFDETRRGNTSSRRIFCEVLNPRTDQRMQTLIQNILERIHDFIVYGYLVMQVRAGGKPAGAADPAQDVAPFHFLAVAHEYFGQMAVGRLDAMPMIDPNVISHFRIIGGHDDFTFSGGSHVFSSWATDIHARMEGFLAGKG